jgi:hypothetical protein
MRARAIGPVGTASRALVGLFLLYMALIDGPPFADGFAWGLKWYDAVLGLVVLPAIMVSAGLAARRYADGPLRYMGPLAIALNLIVGLALLSNQYTGGGATLFIGTAMLIAAWRGQAGCEGTVLSNTLLGRDDQIGCPLFSPIDTAEAEIRSRPGDGLHELEIDR